MLAAQLFVSVGAVALAGWTLGVTNDLIRERSRLRERVIQLEESMAGRGIVVPATPPVVETPAPGGANVYPGEVGLAETPAAAEAVGVEASVETIERTEPPGSAPTQTSPQPAPAVERDFSRVIGDLFAPAPPLRVLVLHARAGADAALAERLAGELAQTADVRVIIDVMPARDPRQSGYAYFDGRQSRAAAALVAQFHDLARRHEIAPWSAQLRGVALPAQGEYTPERLDIVLPPLPQPAEIQRIDPRALRVAPAPPG
jgi:hypothetical protein